MKTSAVLTTFCSLWLLPLLVETCFASIGATLSECEAIYGQAQHTDSRDGKAVKGFLISDGILKNSLVFAVFDADGKVDEVKYKNRSANRFSALQFEEILSYNTPDKKNPFVETGLTPDKSKRIWARADYTAYVVSEEESPMVSVFTQAAAIDFFKKQ